MLVARWPVFGIVSQLLLDMVSHTDVAPFGPWSQSNPFYVDGAHGVLSIVLLIGLAWWVLDWWDARRPMTGIKKGQGRSYLEGLGRKATSLE